MAVDDDDAPQVISMRKHKRGVSERGENTAIEILSSDEERANNERSKKGEVMDLTSDEEDHREGEDAATNAGGGEEESRDEDRKYNASVLKGEWLHHAGCTIFEQ